MRIDAEDKTNRDTSEGRFGTIEVVFDGPMDAAAIDNTDFEVEDAAVTYVPARADVYPAKPGSVFLTLATDLRTLLGTTIRVVNSISDAAGNTANSGSKYVQSLLTT